MRTSSFSTCCVQPTTVLCSTGLPATEGNEEPEQTRKSQCLCPSGTRAGDRQLTSSVDPRTQPLEFAADLSHAGPSKNSSIHGCASQGLLLFLTPWLRTKKKKKIRFEKASEEAGFSYNATADIWKSSELTERIFMESNDCDVLSSL